MSDSPDVFLIQSQPSCLPAYCLYQALQRQRQPQPQQHVVVPKMNVSPPLHSSNECSKTFLQYENAAVTAILYYCICTRFSNPNRSASTTPWMALVLVPKVILATLDPGSRELVDATNGGGTLVLGARGLSVDGGLGWVLCRVSSVIYIVLCVVGCTSYLFRVCLCLS
jgi:hypothetical protein